MNAWKQRLATTQEGDYHITDASNWSSAQSSSGKMTPLEGWSDIGSDTTKTIREETAPILFQELKDAAKLTENFTRYLELLMRVNMRNKHKFVGLLGQSCAEATECLHENYSHLINNLDKLLHAKQRRSSLEHVLPTCGSPLASQATDQIVNSQDVSNRHEDRALEAIFSGVGSEVTNEDVARLTRHWAS